MSITGKRINEMRESHGWTDQDLAERVGTSKASISRWENGLFMPKSEDIKKLAVIFGVSPVWLMGMDVSKYVSIEGNKPIPVIGVIAAGKPIIANENIEAYEYVEKDRQIDFCLLVKGDSMKNARICNGDTVFVKKQSDVESGEIAVVLIDGEEATLKRVIKDDKGIILMPENPDYKPIILRKSDMKDVKILGKVVSVKFEV